MLIWDNPIYSYDYATSWHSEAHINATLSLSLIKNMIFLAYSYGNLHRIFTYALQMDVFNLNSFRITVC